jgi:hypothetical protein
MARLRYGSYSHAVNEASVQMAASTIDNEAGQPYAVRRTWTIGGRAEGDDTTAVVNAMALLEAAYSFNFSDLVLEDDSGNVLHALRNAGSLSGVRIIQPVSYPVGEGAELSTFRNYTIVAQADYPAIGAFGGGFNPLRAFSETLSFSGGGPRRAVIECANVPPQEQFINAFTAFRAIQSGSAVGMFAYPLIPAPLFPGKEEVAGQPTIGSPKLKNGIYIEWPVSWSYTFVSATPLVGLPNRWPSSG